ncbi:hypothetical protein [Devosia sp. SD17-2]|uniref:hypothetical protein n=1 Tax=Devosia sp. SD17-2 TaxID=2976459 RepID=UPI0023D80AC7|nr:hypothetical protein [Devosia sp. SD17-2]WEJ31714.1 hypothetical protein NYQ88_12445 [Devosia sp. SD17-2]
MDWHQIPWSAIVTGLLAIVGFIGWLVRLEAKTQSNRREIEIVDEKVGLTNTRVGLTETALVELRTTAITRADLKEVEERVTGSVKAVGEQVSGEIDRLVRVIEKPAPRSRSTRS